MKNWGAQIYDAESYIDAYSYRPFTDLSDAVSATRWLQDTDTWRDMVPGAPVEIVYEKATTWTAESGTRLDERIRKFRGRLAWLITLGQGCVTLGMCIHEWAHIPPWGKKPDHGAAYLKTYLDLWRINARRPYYGRLLDALRTYGVPIERYV